MMLVTMKSQGHRLNESSLVLCQTSYQISDMRWQNSDLDIATSKITGTVGQQPLRYQRGMFYVSNLYNTREGCFILATSTILERDVLYQQPLRYQRGMFYISNLHDTREQCFCLKQIIERIEMNERKDCCFFMMEGCDIFILLFKIRCRVDLKESYMVDVQYGGPS